MHVHFQSGLSRERADQALELELPELQLKLNLLQELHYLNYLHSVPVDAPVPSPLPSLNPQKRGDST